MTLYSYKGRYQQGGFLLRLTYLLLTWFFHVAIFVVALIGLANYWMPLLADYKGVLEQELSSFVGNKISIGSIRVDRDGDTPRWVLHNLQLTESDGHSPISIRQLTLGIDLQESLRTLRPQPADIALDGVEFILRQQGNALPELQGLRFPLPGQKNAALNIERQSPIRIRINDGAVHWIDAPHQRSLDLEKLRFTGEFLPNEITVQAEAVFPAEIGKTVAVDVQLGRDPGSTASNDWSGTVHARTKIFDLAALPSPLLQALGVAAGALDLDVNIRLQAGKPLHIGGEGKIAGLVLGGTPEMPAVDNVDAEFKADNTGGSVKVTAKNSRFVYKDWFEKPIPIDTLDAALQWQVQDQSWHWRLMDLNLRNADVWAKGSGTLDTPLKQPPNIDLNMTFATQRTVDNVRHYIPSIVIDSTEAWLKSAIVSGYVPQGEFILRGNPADFPFKGKSGEFDIRFDIENGVLAYLPEWPVARDVKGELRFHNEGMAASVKQARIMDLAVVGGTVDIPDMLGETHLLLDLKTQGDLQGHMDYLRDAPIGKGLRDFMQVAKFAGNSDLHLKLDVPLDAPVFAKKGVTVDGLVKLQDNRFSIPNYNQTFEQLKGEIRFDRYGVTAEGVVGKYLEQPITLKVVTDKAQGNIVVDVQQNNKPAAFLPTAMQGLATYVQGSAAITTRLILPTFDFSGDKSQASLKIRANSTLQGVTIPLPEPLGKTVDSALPTQVAVDIPFDATQPWQTQVTVGEQLAVNARVVHHGQQDTAVSIGLGKSKLPALPEVGIVMEGELQALDLLALPAVPLPALEAGQIKPRLFHANLNVGDLRLGRQSLGRAEVTAKSEGALHLNLKADKAQASLTLPTQEMTTARAEVALRALDLSELSQGAFSQKAVNSSVLSPKEFPALKLRCTDCRNGDFVIQHLFLDLQKDGEAMAIKQLEIKNPQLVFTSHNGRWFVGEDGSPRTTLQADLRIPEPGKLLETNGKSSGLQGGALQANTKLHWDGSPFGFASNALRGEAEVRLGRGTLEAIEPGFGRLLGLLDVAHLPDRLSLDFRDMMGKGITFDSITGTFRLDRGLLSTDDTVIDAAALVAGIKGSTDIVHKTHQQQVTVIPNFRSTLPVVGVAVGGLSGGAALLLFNTLTHRDAAEKLKSAGGFQYQVTGSWDNPTVMELKPPVTKAEVDVLVH